MNTISRTLLITMSVPVLTGGLLTSCDKKDGQKTGQAGGGQQIPLPIVKVMDVPVQDVPVYQEWIGSVTGKINAAILPRVQGYITSQDYLNGEFVKKGQLLFTLDDRPFIAELHNAEAQLAQAQANYDKFKADVARYRPLVETGAVSKKNLDDAVSSMESAAAQIKQAEASIEAAKLNVTYTRITSPIDGLAGIAEAQVGDLVSPSSRPLTTVSQVNPVKVDFSVAEQDILEYFRKHPEFSPNNLKDGGDTTAPQLELFLSNGEQYPEAGRVISMDRQVDKKTGTLNLVALFPNPRGMLRPGMFTRVRAVSDVMKNAMVVPQRAIRDYQGIQTVDVVTKEQDGSYVTKTVPVTVGPIVGRSGRVVLKGIKPGEMIVVEGLMKGNGKVKPVPYVENKGAAQPQVKEADPKSGEGEGGKDAGEKTPAKAAAQ